jgi:hypothetical protein
MRLVVSRCGVGERLGGDFFISIVSHFAHRMIDAAAIVIVATGVFGIHEFFCLRADIEQRVLGITLGQRFRSASSRCVEVKIVFPRSLRR